MFRTHVYLDFYERAQVSTFLAEYGIAATPSLGSAITKFLEVLFNKHLLVDTTHLVSSHTRSTPYNIIHIQVPEALQNLPYVYKLSTWSDFLLSVVNRGIYPSEPIPAFPISQEQQAFVTNAIMEQLDNTKHKVIYMATTSIPQDQVDDLLPILSPSDYIDARPWAIPIPSASSSPFITRYNEPTWRLDVERTKERIILTRVDFDNAMQLALHFGITNPRSRTNNGTVTQVLESIYHRLLQRI